MNYKKIIKYIFDKYYRFTINSIRFGMHKKMDDKDYLCRIYKGIFGRELNLEDPKTFNEKIQWLKVYNRRPEYTIMVDKYAVKEYVARRIGEDYIIPTLGAWESFDDINFDLLPNKFVLKCTHDSGGLIICKDKKSFDKKNAKKRINASLRRNYYELYREWPYKNVKPRIIAEAYLEDSNTQELRDYKFFCFDGEVKLLYVASDRQKRGEETKFDFFDTTFAHLPIINGHPNSSKRIEKPINFDKMIELSSILSKGIPHIRCDFYEVNGKVYFGELTFSHNSGLIEFSPNEWDTKMGSWIKLPNKGIDVNDENHL